MTEPNGNETNVDPQTPAAGQPPDPGQSVTPEYVTAAQLDARDEALKEAFATAYRGVQSQTDQAVSQMQKVQQEIAKSIAGFPGATPEDIEKFSREKALESLFETQQPPAEPGTTPGQGATPAKPVENGAQSFSNLVDAEADRMVKQYGFDVAKDDPEFEIIKKANDATATPFDFLSAYNQALTAKAERQNKTTPARMPAMGTGSSVPANSISEINDPDELFELAKKAGKI